mmetsp:Transcript_7822/g.7064  ORF Transcript_7822/g.7064 Transcript_7822/m.7064 type:complete len:201 (-) Transcript_7822:182-784(-)|eukprot:CAMPEP_0114588184 /NCGR_PEP_ID=MMETSP0125-20121206/10950_1 /TAXON_ID=485358 ORGANISM="Aristerostoma sp., Strain ATCC 50986" /NCGR_SAMPLE_ID=MMETSP0125 /ASSEMBLY_ACC=CAM_ASM_000245 /LENGTH=200 /DNA_ID=CAMNT_0001784453 /DNA_START=61 /DNA_END=663 /DNA_ORIENTATION=+
MSKIIFAFLLIAVVANGRNIFEAVRTGDFAKFNNDEGSSTSDAINFFEGLGAGLGQPAAAKTLIKCSYNDTNDLITDVQKLIDDINDKKWQNVVQDGIDILDEIQDMESDCPDGANPFIYEFQPFVNAWNNNSNAVIQKITKNCLNNAFEVIADVAEIIEDFNNSDYYDAGDEFGALVQIALDGYLNVTSSTFEENWVHH